MTGLHALIGEHLPDPGDDLDPHPQVMIVIATERGSAGATAYYQQLRARDTGHQAALRQLSNRWIGILHGCLKIGTT